MEKDYILDLSILDELGLTHLFFFLTWLEDVLDEDELRRLHIAASDYVENNKPHVITAVVDFFRHYIS